MVMTAIEWGLAVIGIIVTGSLFGQLIYAVLTPPKPSAAEVARTEMAERYATHTPAPRRDL